MQLQKELQAMVAEICTRELELPQGVLLTIQRVRLAQDLSLARVWVSVLPFARSADAFAVLRARRGDIQFLMAQKLTRYRVPKLEFVLDDSIEKTDHLEQLLDKVETER